MIQKRRILVAALNWGLGHASRCIPLVRILLDLDQEVVIASDGNALQLLRSNFPDLEYLELPELNVRYSSKSGAVLGIIAQLPKLSSYIRKEHNALQEFLNDHAIDLIISDNRYGIYSENIPSVIITHQLKVKLPLAGTLATEMIKARVKYFDECWVPDNDQHSLSAELSSRTLPITKLSIGSLSQFQHIEKKFSMQKKDELLAILSGPEPSRTIFEEKIIEQAEKHKIQTLIVRGTKSERLSSNNEYVSFKGQLASEELFELIQQYQKIICRSGFSSIMDLSCMEKKALLVPTPGQSEQTYLATYHRDRQNFYSVKEKDLNLKNDLAIAYNGTYQPKNSCLDFSLQKDLIGNRLELLSQKAPSLL